MNIRYRLRTTSWTAQDKPNSETKHMELRRRTFIGAMMASTMLVRAGMAQETPTKGGTLIISQADGTPRVLNPAVQSGTGTGLPGTKLFATPLRFDENWNPQPYLAEAWEVSEDGLQVTLHLRENATFHDGVPITSDDVAFSIDVIKNNHPFKTMLAPVTSVDTPDPLTAVINLEHPHPTLILAMSGPLMSIIPKHIYGDGQDLKTHPRNSEDVVGSGPFKLVEFQRDEHIILERYDGYWEDHLPHLDRIVIRILPESSGRTIAMENGELQLTAFESEPTVIQQLQKADGVTITNDGYGGIGPIDWLAMNTTRGPLQDKRVRQAIAYAIDKNFILNALLFGTAKDARTGIHPDSPFYNPDVPTYEFDLDKAAALLDEAGFPLKDGKRFELNIELPGFPGYRSRTEYVKAALAKVGIEVTVRSYPDFASWADVMGKMEFDLAWDNVYNWGDPVIGVHRTFISSNIGNGVWSNTQGYSNPKVDEILALAANENDQAKRKALYDEFQAIVAEDLPLYPVNATPLYTAYSDNVGGLPKGIWSVLDPMDGAYLKA
ncbi:ABC transporter substrate-binding protein [Defluviimonas salinarum]|uniref:ABC transporter substrate-binding protein n=1 Tax=Defluviimonas salinarum TaxID=2992147 RepID=A0ABT3J7I8_9RHOB|nr:ABC transporter substrate-binding protein [Defluviimonas salinarum]MCW3783647.1 ABC transporter substrate-binding protein [Defluviimonas salinarum]